MRGRDGGKRRRSVLCRVLWTVLELVGPSIHLDWCVKKKLQQLQTRENFLLKMQSGTFQEVSSGYSIQRDGSKERTKKQNRKREILLMWFQHSTGSCPALFTVATVHQIQQADVGRDRRTCLADHDQDWLPSYPVDQYAADIWENHAYSVAGSIDFILFVVPNQPLNV